MVRVSESTSALAAASLLLLAGCTGSGSPVPTAESLSGTVFDSSGNGLPDVVLTVRSAGAARSSRTVTDAGGHFVLASPPSGRVAIQVHADGVDPSLGTFPGLDLVHVIGNGAATLSPGIVLPNLAEGAGASIAVDGTGATLAPTTLTAPDGASLEVPELTVITLGTSPAVGAVELNVTSVPLAQSPLPLPGSLDVGSLVTVQPARARFDPPLNLVLPNPRGFPVGTPVDIWSFDPDTGAWTERAGASGSLGEVVDAMGSSVIAAPGGVCGGGWYAAAVASDAACSTTVTGLVRAAGSGAPVGGANIALGTGQFARTDAEGRFSIGLVPAYAPGLGRACAAVDLTLVAIGSVDDGAHRIAHTFLPGAIVPGGTSDLGVFDLPVSAVGSVAGVVDEAPVSNTVTIQGPMDTAVPVHDGSYFAASLEPGVYTASLAFESGTVTAPFEVVAGRTTFAHLRAHPSSADTVRVKALYTGTDLSAAGQFVTLQGAQGAPRYAVTDPSGVALFESAPPGPYTATVQRVEAPYPGQLYRTAVTVVGAEPSGPAGTLVLPASPSSSLGGAPLDATVQATVKNAVPGGHLVYLSSAGSYLGEPAADEPFFVPTRSDTPFDAALLRYSPLAPALTHAVVLGGLTVGPGETLELEFDFHGERASTFDHSVAVAYSNAPPTGAKGSIFLRVEGSGRLDFPLFHEDGPFPVSLNLPDPSSGGLAGLDVSLRFSRQGGGESLSTCDLPIGPATPVSVTADFLGFPTSTSPADGQSLPTLGPGDTLSFLLDPGGEGRPGFNELSMWSLFDEGELDVRTGWRIFLAPDTTAASVPAVFPTQRMFGRGPAGLRVSAQRFELSGFEYATWFDEDLPENLAALEGLPRCEAVDGIEFDVEGSRPLR